MWSGVTHRSRLLSVALVAALICSAGLARAAYRIGPEDVLEIRFWQKPDLNSEVRVRLDGMITLDMVGEIMAAGKTPEELQNDIARQISRLDKSVTQAIAKVVQFNYQHVFVTGQVNQPGKLTFEEIPDLMTIVNEAGWVTEFGDISRVTIVRGGERAGQVEVVDLARAVATGSIAGLPQIHRQDAIDIPSTPVGFPGVDIAAAADQRNTMYVIGAVTTPGHIPYEENVDVLEAVALAGGPTETADLKRVKVLTKDGYYGQTLQVDLEEYAASGVPSRYILRKEDIVVVPNQRGGFIRQNIGVITATAAVLTSAVLLYEALRPSDESN